MSRFTKRLLFAIFFISTLSRQVNAAHMLIPVGQVVGLELQNNTVTVAAFDQGSQAEAAGIRVGDRLLSIDGRNITCAEDVRSALDRSDGTVSVTLLRGDRIDTLRIHPAITQDGPKLGIYLKQGVTGIGTVTYYDPQTKAFGTLGHGVNDPSGKLLSLTGGSIYRAKVVAVRKGTSGEPGQLMGSLVQPQPIGSISRNTVQGVFGTADIPFAAEALPVGSASSVTTGDATILSTIEGESVREYSVEILKVYPASRQNGRNFLLKVTDPALLSTTGGIVQGMSGSPIIQDGKLIGAVTHVLVNDPQTGYGIFIENMLEAAS